MKSIAIAISVLTTSLFARPLTNPTHVSAAGWYACANDDSGIRCWGSNDYGEATPPSLFNPMNVSVGRTHACTLDDEGVKCWGQNSDGQLNVPK